MHPPHLSAFCFLLGKEGGVEPPTRFSKRGCLTGPPLLVGVTGKDGSDFFQGGCAFHIKNKLKSEIFDDKKGYKQKSFSLLTKDSNWENL